MELKYKEFSVCLGNFRPIEALEWMEIPRLFCVSHTHDKRVDINFFSDEDMFSGGSTTMQGSIIVWFNHNSVIVTTE
jgi:hypothetical protein